MAESMSPVKIKHTWVLNPPFSPVSNFTETRSMGAALIHVGRQTDGHDEANRRFLRLCERA